MQAMRRALLLLCLPWVLLGCHSGTTRLVDVTVPDEVAQAYTEAAPGLMVAELGGLRAWYVALCGQTFEAPLILSYDINYSCMGEEPGTEVGDEEPVRVWIEPLPAGWDAAALCASQEVPEFYRPQAEPQGEDVEALAEAAAPAWPQAEGIGTWRRDVTPCGGSLRVELTLD